MKFIIITLILFTSVNLQSEINSGEYTQPVDTTDRSTAGYDGPYITYIDNNIAIKQIIKNGTEYTGTSDTLPQAVNKFFYSQVNDTFTFFFSLKDKINIEQCIFEFPNKLIAISDIEGNFFALYDFLLNNNVIDKNNNWTFGNGHLVLAGDFFDRGLNVTECLWFIYYLEQEAVKHGGYVHFILGNHEIMNMSGDLRYVRNKYFENCKLMNEDYSSLYKPDTELGRWLSSKNVAEKIGNYLFVHGGISPELDSISNSLEIINSAAREYYFSSKAAKQSGDKLHNILYSGKFSPFWYRGYIKQTITEPELDKIISNFEVSTIIVGHTIVEDVKSFYNGKVIGIDTDHAGGDTEGLLIEDGKYYRTNIQGNRIELK